MSVFLPPGNDSNVCQGLEDRVAVRPPPSNYHTLLITIDVVFCVLFALSIPFLFWLRNEPRFSKIRPFSISATLMVVCIVYVQGCLLPSMVLGFPCALELFLHVFGSLTATSVTSARVLIFVIESQYSKVAGAMDSAMARDVASTGSSTSHKESSAMESELGFTGVFLEVLLLGFGFKRLDSLSIQTLGDIRRSYLRILISLTIPPFLVFVIGVLSVQAYREGCTDCPMSIEFILIVLISPTIFGLFLVKMMSLAYAVKQDQQEVRKELFWTLITGPHWIYIGYIVELIDPDHLSFDRVFSFQILTVMGPFFFWLTVVVWQIIRAIQYKRERASKSRQVSNTQNKNYLDECNSDPATREEFQAFVSARYAMEHLNFVDDVIAFKTRYEDQPEKWHKSKAKNIVGSYIRFGSAQEVNISASTRERITKVDVTTTPRLLNLFDDALDEVLTMMNTGLWIDFKNSRKRRATSGAVVAAQGIF